MGKSVRRIKINGTPNRMGLIFLVLRAIADYGINIITMESDPYICCKIEWNDENSEEDFLRFMQERVPEIESISYIDLMEYERIEVELSTLLNSIDDAIIKADALGNIESYNESGEQLLKTSSKINRTLQELFGGKRTSVASITAQSTIEFSRKEKGKEQRYYALINPIKNEQNKVTSIFVIVKKYENIKNLINTIMRPSMVTFDNITGESPALMEAVNLARQVAKSNASVMLRGESGTGKELFARAIHMESDRAKGPFIAVNCASIPETLIESEFFGYEKGSFTGANAAGKQGFFEQAAGGTLFLDEIGELAPHLQSKLLRALQEKKIRRIGGRQEMDIDVRIISATNRNLEEMIADNSFREDLYYRLNIIPIHIPPLRAREGDVEKLTRYFVEDICRNNERETLPISETAMKKLKSYNWPGNIRELKNVLERAVFMTERVITDQDIILDNKKPVTPQKENNVKAGHEYPVDLPAKLRDIEMEYIVGAVEEFGSCRKAAQNLNISHTSLTMKYKERKL